MLKEITIENFKSIKKLKLKLGRLNILIGPNNSGKSNIIDCFRFLGEFTEFRFPEKITDQGGLNSIIFGKDDANEISIGYKTLLNKKEFAYHIKIRNIKGCIHIAQETLRFKEKDQRDKTLFVLDGEKGMMCGESGKYRDFSKVACPAIGVFLLYSPDKIVPAEFLTYLKNWRFYNFIPSHMRDFPPSEKNYITDKDGKNFAQVLNTLQGEERAIFLEIEDILKTALGNQIELLSITPTDDKRTKMIIKEKYHHSKFDSQETSDGILNFLGYLSVLLSPKPASLICFEEPENHIHPKLFGILSELIKDAAERTQIIVSTHSTSFLDYMNLEDLIIVGKKEGATTCRRERSRPALDEAIKALGLGNVWYSGHLG